MIFYVQYVEDHAAKSDKGRSTWRRMEPTPGGRIWRTKRDQSIDTSDWTSKNMHNKSLYIHSQTSHLCKYRPSYGITLGESDMVHSTVKPKNTMVVTHLKKCHAMGWFPPSCRWHRDVVRRCCCLLRVPTSPWNVPVWHQLLSCGEITIFIQQKSWLVRGGDAIIICILDRIDVFI